MGTLAVTACSKENDEAVSPSEESEKHCRQDGMKVSVYRPEARVCFFQLVIKCRFQHHAPICVTTEVGAVKS